MKKHLLFSLSLLSSACACAKPQVVVAGKTPGAAVILKGGHIYDIKCFEDSFLGFDQEPTKDGIKLKKDASQQFAVDKDQELKAIAASGVYGECSVEIAKKL